MYCKIDGIWFFFGTNKRGDFDPIVCEEKYFVADMTMEERLVLRKLYAYDKEKRDIYYGNK